MSDVWALCNLTIVKFLKFLKMRTKERFAFFLHQNIKFLAIEIFEGCKVTSSHILKK